MARLEDGQLFIETSRTPSGGLRFDWHGQSTARRPAETLLPFFVESLESLGTGGAVEMSFVKLAYFNSSTVAALIKIIKHARNSGVALKFLYDGASSAQVNSFESLRIFEKDDGLLELQSTKT